MTSHRTQTALDLAGAGADRQHQPAAREVVLHAHFDATLDDLAPSSVRPAGWRRASGWSSSTRSRTGAPTRGTRVTVKPVIDLNADLSTPAYEVPDRIREQVILRDTDVRVPVVHPPGPRLRHRPRRRVRPPRRSRGQTAARSRRRPHNLAALCRFHHRLKTHTAWRYEMTDNGCFDVDQSRTATAISGTVLAPLRSTMGSSRPIDHDDAPHPADIQPAGSERMSAGHTMSPDIAQLSGPRIEPAAWRAYSR